MLQINKINLFQFRNYSNASFAFERRIVGICGANGSGKTNLLDAIYYLSFTKSYFSKPDSANVQHGVKGMRLQGNYLLQNQPCNITCIVRENNKKEIALNGDDYKKFSEHLGKLPCVMIAPDDVALITGTSEERRKLLDTLLSQLNASYLQQLIAYNKLLQQRNSLLKQAQETGHLNEDLLSIYSEQLSAIGDWIYVERNLFLETFLPLVAEQYQYIAGGLDDLTIAYQSELQEHSMNYWLDCNRKKDQLLGRTCSGIHRDDIVFGMHRHPFKSEASQGQRKSLLFAIKLSEWQALKQYKGFAPILLLDDVFEKLDANRMHNLLHKVVNEGDGQIFISDTHKERLQIHLTQIGADFELIEL